MTILERSAILKRVEALSDEKLIALSRLLDYTHLDTRAVDQAWFGNIIDAFAPVRAALAESGVSEAELEADIDRAIQEVRRGET